MVVDLTGCAPDRAQAALDDAGSIKVALAMVLLGIDAETAQRRLATAQGHLARVL